MRKWAKYCRAWPNISHRKKLNLYVYFMLLKKLRVCVIHAALFMWTTSQSPCLHETLATAAITMRNLRSVFLIVASVSVENQLNNNALVIKINTIKPRIVVKHALCDGLVGLLHDICTGNRIFCDA